jgi:hypothetical protein
MMHSEHVDLNAKIPNNVDLAVTAGNASAGAACEAARERREAQTAPALAGLAPAVTRGRGPR